MSPQELTLANTFDDQPTPKSTALVAASHRITEQVRIIRFHGRALIEVDFQPPYLDQPFKQFMPLHKDQFESIVYPILGGISRSRMSDVFAYVINTAPDYSHHDHLIGFGSEDFIWNTQTLTFESVSWDEVVWRSPFMPSTTPGQSAFIRSLANDDGHYEDLLQSMAPLVSYQKPDGAIWWVGSGANGKSSLMEALYRIFPNQLASLTIKRLTDERDTPLLNGQLANVVKESSEGRIEDTQVYKSIGTHEDFRVHKFHSQESLLIRGNMHHIFSANTIPVFNDKGYSARRRTFVVPFHKTFASTPDFNNQTFTREELGRIIAQMLQYALRLREQEYRYKFSEVTLHAKAEYDAEANNAEEYAKDLIAQGVVGFDSFEPVKRDYEHWCAQMGHVELGMHNLRRAVTNAGFERVSYARGNGSVGKKYRLMTLSEADIVPYGMGKPGFYSAPGFVKESPQQTTMSIESILEDW